MMAFFLTKHFSENSVRFTEESRCCKCPFLQKNVSLFHVGLLHDSLGQPIALPAQQLYLLGNSVAIASVTKLAALLVNIRYIFLHYILLSYKINKGHDNNKSNAKVCKSVIYPFLYHPPIPAR
jgi:hypothetical protein